MVPNFVAMADRDSERIADNNRSPQMSKLGNFAKYVVPQIILLSSVGKSYYKQISDK